MKQIVTVHSYMFDSRHALCEHVEMTVQELFEVSERGVDDRHGAHNDIVGMACSRSCLLITTVDCDLSLVAVSGASAELADWNLIRAEATNTRYKQDGSTWPSVTTETPGEFADVALEEVAGAFTSFRYAAEVLHCAEAVSGDVRPADPNNPPTAEVDVPPDDLRGPLQRVYGSKLRRRRRIRGELEVEDSDGFVVREGLVDSGSRVPSARTLTVSNHPRRPVIVRAAGAAERIGSAEHTRTEPGAVFRHAWAVQRGARDERGR